VTGTGNNVHLGVRHHRPPGSRALSPWCATDVRIPNWRAERALWTGYSGMTGGEGPTNTVEGGP
jgi:hypothetical protein